MDPKVFLSALGLAASVTHAQVDVGGGQTNVLLDTATLSAAASLNLSGVLGPVIAPGNLGANSVAFPINARDAAPLPTTFSYDPGDLLGSFSGTIEHSGAVLFNNNTVEVGNFTIGFDAARAGTLGGLVIGADLFVSPEFSSFLFDNQLSASNLQGTDVGDALVEAIPSPASGGAGGRLAPCDAPSSNGDMTRIELLAARRPRSQECARRVRYCHTATGLIYPRRIAVAPRA